MARKMFIEISTKCKGMLETAWLTTCYSRRGLEERLTREVFWRMKEEGKGVCISDVGAPSSEYNLLLCPYRAPVTFSSSLTTTPPWSLLLSSVLYNYVFSPIEILLSSSWLYWPQSGMNSDNSKQGFCFCFSLFYICLFFFIFFFLILLWGITYIQKND